MGDVVQLRPVDDEIDADFDAAEAISQLRAGRRHRITWGFVSGNVEPGVIVVAMMTARRRGYGIHVLACDGARVITFTKDEP